ncbi:S28 family serine protease [Actinophytocola xinjiangensis]|uniref:S28 family serine protease n=1 Tax=Actinophytocola xinjiangensis TaxID=485602 RepID=UPI000AADADD4|nr:S28 family serine protease [Actinophytocola xinjiangensis]
MSIRTRTAVLVPALAASLIGLTAAIPAHAAPAPDLADQLEALPGVTVTAEQPPPAEGYRFFLLTIRQPVDHTNPAGATFEQRFQLLHRAQDRPMVLHTTGYNMPEYAFRSEPTALLDANQISVEQRFFSPSRPDPADWDTLTIWQGATDHHRIVQTLAPLYTQAWISTGASKGGMTSVYHRRFYPRDVDGVVAYVTPNDANNRADTAYDRFFDTVGTTPACRTALKALQREALNRRTDLVTLYDAYAADNDLTFDEVFGSSDRAFEMIVLDLEWVFWQHSSEAACDTVPGADATTEEIFAFIETIAVPSFYSDEGITPYAPYYYQAATQLGWPQPKFRYLKDLLRYPNLYVANSSLPADLRAPHDPLPMSDVDRWVSREASEILFVYGGNDPWGAERFHPGGPDTHTFTAPGANHGADIELLTPADRASATATVLRWGGVEAVTAPLASAALAELDQRDPRNQRWPM